MIVSTYLMSLFGVFVLVMSSIVHANHENSQNCSKTQHVVPVIGGVIEQSSRVGREQRIAMEMAVHNFCRMKDITCSCPILHLKDSQGNSVRSVFEVIYLIESKQVQAIVGTISPQQATLVAEFDKTTKKIPIISLTPTATSSLPQLAAQPSFLEMSHDVTTHMQCIAAIVGHFNWRKVTPIYENHSTFISGTSPLIYLSDALQLVNATIEPHFIFPPFRSIVNPSSFFEDELKKLRMNGNRVFILLKSSLRSCVLLFEKAKQLGMMEEGFVWIVSDDIASLLDSVDQSVISSMQGVVGFKTNFEVTSDTFKEFKLQFRREFRRKYPDEEEYSNPSIYALRTYDATWAAVKAIEVSKQSSSSTSFLESISHSEFNGLSGDISFKSGKLAQLPTFCIINVIGKSYREIGFWSPESGFSSDTRGSGQANLGLIYWPGDTHRIPSGHVLRDKRKQLKINSVPTKDIFNKFYKPSDDSDKTKTDVTSFSKEMPEAVMMQLLYRPSGTQKILTGQVLEKGKKPLKVGVPAEAVFNQFVKVTYDPDMTKTHVSGLSIELLEAVVKQLPYSLSYVLFPYKGSYDDLVAEVYNKNIDVAVGDIEITADRYQYAEFSQPYMETELVMVVPVKRDGMKEGFIFLDAFTTKMWIVLMAMTVGTVSVVWFNEHVHGNKDFEASSTFEYITRMLWFAIAILSFSHRELIKNNLSRLVLAIWFCVNMIVGICFSATFSSIITVPRFQPSLDLHKNNYVVGCNGNSFIGRYLVDVLLFNPKNIRHINSIEDYPEAFKKGEIEAAFFVSPHANVFLATYCQGYEKIGPTIKLGGFGFVFQKGSTLAEDISEAVLKVVQNGEINTLEENMLKSLSKCSLLAQESDRRLDPNTFTGLFLISGCISALVFFTTLSHLVTKRQDSIWNLTKSNLIMTRVGKWLTLLLKIRAVSQDVGVELTPNQAG